MLNPLWAHRRRSTADYHNLFPDLGVLRNELSLDPETAEKARLELEGESQGFGLYYRFYLLPQVEGWHETALTAENKAHNSTNYVTPDARTIEELKVRPYPVLFGVELTLA